MDMEVCRRGVVEGKEKQVVASFVQLTEANWTHLDNVSSSIQCLLQKAQILEVRTRRNIGGRNIEPKIYGQGCQDLTFNWPASTPPRWPGYIIVKGLWGHGYGAAGIIVVELGDQGLEILLYPAPDPCSASWRGSQEERYELNSATYCPIVPL